MARGESWDATEDVQLTRSWVAISSTGAALKASDLNQRVYEHWLEHKTSNIHGDRTPPAITSRWKKLCPVLTCFNGAVINALKSIPSGSNEEGVIDNEMQAIPDAKLNGFERTTVLTCWRLVRDAPKWRVEQDVRGGKKRNAMDTATEKTKRINGHKEIKAHRREPQRHLVREAATTGRKRKVSDDAAPSSEDDDKLSPSNKKDGATAWKVVATAVADLTAMMKASHKYKREEIQVQKQANALALRQIELDEQRYRLDKAERDARVALERRERQTQLEFMQSTVELLRTLTKKT
ncbi:hypothetical protein DYB37_006095 [Aphanomyces astaci]|uniref:No apical meristem-associated C-terminal domain-containing protein n=1 Tax=Aphanomyces astaci TaxID=112090 RepID=A0A3R6XW25_APHAT|nr:hypothetical protein DYB35_004961 [Aphanomyces astaci]RHZ13776.1 hypothetical protein DYB37_006095 [Aphanomyces astaci]